MVLKPLNPILVVLVVVLAVLVLVLWGELGKIELLSTPQDRGPMGKITMCSFQLPVIPIDPIFRTMKATMLYHMLASFW